MVSLRNDQVLWGVKEASVAILLKMGIDTPIVKNAVRFLRYLLSLSENKEMILRLFYLPTVRVRPLPNMLLLCFQKRIDKKFEFLHLGDGLLFLLMLLIQSLIIMRVLEI